MRQHLCNTYAQNLLRSSVKLALTTCLRRITYQRYQSTRFSSFQRPRKNARRPIASLVTTAGFIWLLYPSEEFARLRVTSPSAEVAIDDCVPLEKNGVVRDSAAVSSETGLLNNIPLVTALVNLEWSSLPDKIAGLVVPEWSRIIPIYLRKLQRELSMTSGSLAEEIWHEALDPTIHPEIHCPSQVRISEELCAEETEFLSRRRKFTTMALARYLGIAEEQINPEDVPVIAMCSSGGGLRALVASTGSYMAAEEDGLFDCSTYTAGVSGSCWLQAILHSSIANGNLSRVLEHIKARAQVHIAYPPTALQLLSSAPTNKYLLSGLVERLRGDEKADFGLVDIYGTLLAARFLIPKGELDVNEADLKLSNQRQFIHLGQNPLPIYTAVRHEIPDILSTDKSIEMAKDVAKNESWFQWFEITPYEFFCEEFNAGIPTWAMGRKYDGGRDLPHNHDFYLPEIRMPFLMGIFGSAFCATLSHYYREIRPTLLTITGFGTVDNLVSDRDEDLSKVHPITPATLPNYVFGLQGQLPSTASESIHKTDTIQLMDAGMSNNLPIYPLLRPGRDVDVVVTFDASADIKQDNWLSVTDGYARQRSIKGWPIGIGWPKGDFDHPEAKEADKDGDVSKDSIKASLDQASASSNKEAQYLIAEAKTDDRRKQAREGRSEDLGYCTVWVGSTAERSSSDEPPPSKALDSSTSWKLREPDAGLAVVYLPLLPNPKVPGINPGTTDFLSTWNFVYTPKQVEQVVDLARANYSEGREQIRECVRAVYERKKKLREQREEASRRLRYRERMRKGQAHKLGEGDLFS